MRSFKTRMREAARRAGPLVLAADIAAPPSRLGPRVIAAARRVEGSACAIKLNMHALLPLGAAGVRDVTREAHSLGMQAIADIKLNDIPSTNAAAAAALWGMGLDALIANPVMGAASLAALAGSARRAGRGVIALGHMSAPEARPTYELRLARRGRLYCEFVRAAARAGVDGIVVGATYPRVIAEVSRIARGVPIYSPGIGAQGGSARRAAEAGASYYIVGRSILGAASPRAEAARVCALVSQQGLGGP